MATVGEYLAERLVQIGIKDYFSVPGDFNLVLLDELLKNKNLRQIGCCNELNAGYAADGYCRAKGISAMVVTFCVGGLSAINALTGSYAEDLPVIMISGGPNSNSLANHETLHHTTAINQYHYVADMFAQVTAKSVIIDDLNTAAYLIDQSIIQAITQQKPVYIEIACNLANQEISDPHPLCFDNHAQSHPEALEKAVAHTLKMLQGATKPVLVAGVKLRPARAAEAFEKLMHASGYATATMPNAKGFINEQDPQYIGVYWQAISSSHCAEIIESSDCYLFAGPIFSDYTTSGYSALISPHKLIQANIDHVIIQGQTYNQVYLRDYLQLLAKKITPNHHSLQAYKNFSSEYKKDYRFEAKKKLSVSSLFTAVQSILKENHSLIIETGDSWFNGISLHLPKGCHYEFQMQYGSIGWATGALLGYATAVDKKRRVIAFIGDGSFQLTAQELSTMIRYQLNPIVFLINNRGYTIEVEIHDGPYNLIKNWHYHKLISVFNAEDGQGWGVKVQTEGELEQAIQTALQNDQLSFIEVAIDRDDCNPKLLAWGSHVASNNEKSKTR